jgi:folate-binding protein YgfZ
MTSPATIELLASYRAAREAAAVRERPARGFISVRGRDRVSFLQGLLTNDVKALAPGSGCYAAWLTPQGRMIADVDLLVFEDRILLDVDGSLTGALLERLDQMLFAEDVQLQDTSPDLVAFEIVGPSSAAVVSLVLGTGALDQSSLARMTPWQHATVSEPGGSFVVMAGESAGEEFRLYVSRSMWPALLDRALSSGASPLSAEAAEALRIERGLPKFTVDMTMETIPLEAGIESRAVSHTKGCYVGQEIIVRIRDRGHGRVAKKLVSLAVQSDQVPAAGTVVYWPQERATDDPAEGVREIGRITSAVFSPAVGAPLALGYVHRDAAEPGTRVRIGSPDGPAATVGPLGLPRPPIPAP